MTECKYCNDDLNADLYAERRSLNLFNEHDTGLGTRIKIDGSRKMLASFKYDEANGGRYHHASFKINYCPVCGRKLGD